MTELPYLIQDLGLILMTAAVVTLVFRWLKQPVVLGYLIAGFIVGPQFTLLPTIKDVGNISIWAEIGVIFMLFGLGLEFSFKKLSHVGKSASITALFEIAFMLAVGFATAQFLGWSVMDSIFLGGILSISSTTIIVRAFEELGLKGRGFVGLVFGVLIVEDLIAILLLVLLSSVALTQTLSGSQLVLSSLRLGFFLVLWFLLGIYLLPLLLHRFRKLLSNETTLIVSIGLCLMMVIIASHVGFSPALGAFVVGSILAETREGHRISQLLVPVRDLFSAVFFVSVGMLIDPAMMKQYFGVILLITALTIVGKFVGTVMGALLSGRSLRNSVQAGMSLSQIGEFSFIIATLGMTLHVTSDFLYPIAVAVSALTTFATPYLIKNADRVVQLLDRKLPEGFKNSLARYEAAMVSSGQAGLSALIWKAYGIKSVLNGVLVVGITLAVHRLLIPMVRGRLPEGFPIDVIACTVTLVLSSPFLWAVFLGAPLVVENDKDGRAQRLERLRSFQLGVSAVRFTLGCLLIAFVVGNFMSLIAISGFVLVAVTAFAVFFFSHYSEPLYRRIEERFISNLTDKERHELEKKSKVPTLAPWNALLAEFTVSPNAPVIAQTLQESQIKERFGVTVAMLERGGRRVLAPTRTDLLLPYDRVFLIGSDEQLAAAKAVIEMNPATVLPPLSDAYGLTSFPLGSRGSPGSKDPFIGKSIRDCGLREAVNGIIVGLERNGERFLNPDSSIILASGDLLWIVGDRELIKAQRS